MAKNTSLNLFIKQIIEGAHKLPIEFSQSIKILSLLFTQLRLKIGTLVIFR